MHLIFIRHADPDYKIDSLTEKVLEKQNFWEKEFPPGKILNTFMFRQWDVLKKPQMKF